MISEIVLSGLTLLAALGFIWVILRNPDKPYCNEF